MVDIAAEPAFVLAVHGTPAPQGSKKFVGLSKAGHGVLVESSKKVAPWRQNVSQAALREILCCQDPTCRKLAPGFPLDEPLVASVVFTLPKPASAPKTRRTWPARYPDVSKLLRSTEDALTEAGVWADDARVVRYVQLEKCFPNEGPDALPVPGVVLQVWRMHDVLNWQTAVLAEPDSLFALIEGTAT
jgi:Holliday junction resolvase RusA-like endonuclease